MTEEQKEKLTSEIIKKAQDSFSAYIKNPMDVIQCMEAMAAAYLRLEISRGLTIGLDEVAMIRRVLLRIDNLKYELLSHFGVSEAEVIAELSRRAKKITESNH